MYLEVFTLLCDLFISQENVIGLTIIYLLKHRSGIILQLDNSDHPVT